jgi:hypothetical protein
MARISTYALDNNINDEDKLVGTDADDNNITKNFTLEGVAEYVIDTLIDPDAIQAYIPVFRNTDNTDGGNATRITGSIIKQNSYPTGSLITIAGDLTLERDQSDTTLTLVSDSSNVGPEGEQHNPSIKFIQDGSSQNAAVGFNIIDDTGGGTIPGTGNRFWIVNAMDDTIGEGGITFGTAQVDGWENAIGRFIIRGDGKGLFGHPDSLYSKTLGSQFEIYDNRDENTTTDPSFSVYSVVDYAAPSGNEGAGGIKQILDVYNNGAFERQEAMMLIPGTNSSDLATSTPLAFYTNSDMDTASPSGFAGIIFDSGNWLLDGSGTFTTTDPGYQLKVAGTGLFTDQVTIPETPVAGTDAASKAYVDLQSTGQVSGTGTTNTLPVWTDGPNSILNDSSISQALDAGNNVKEVDIIATSGYGVKWKFNGAGGKFEMARVGGDPEIFSFTADNTGFYGRNFQMRGTLAVGRSSQASNVTLDVGDPTDTRPAAWFRNGVVISNNPAGVTVDNTSMVVGAGDNDIISGSDNSMIVGKANQLTKTASGTGSDQSAAIGSLNILTDASNSLAVGRGNILIGTGVTDANGLRSQIIGLNNELKNTFSSIVIGGENEINVNETETGQNTHVFGYLNKIAGAGDNVYAIGNKIDIDTNTGSNFYAFGSNIKLDSAVHGTDTMAIGIRNKNTLSYTQDNNKGLSGPALIVGAGSTGYGTHDALIITKQSGSGTHPGSRTILPDLVGFNFANDTDAANAGIPAGGLYRNGNDVKVNFNETAAGGNEGLAYLTPQLLTASATGSGNIDPSYNLVLLSWTGGNGFYTLNLPLASANTNRLIRITTDGSLAIGAGDKIDITATGGETIDGAASFQISKQYEGLAVFSTGTEWIIAQAKAH